MRYTVLVVVLLAGCVSPERRAAVEAHRAACANADSEVTSLVDAGRISWTEFASLATIYYNKCGTRNRQNDLKLSYLHMLAARVDARQMTPQEATFALQKFDYDMRMQNAQLLMQYEAQMRQQQLLERSVRAQEQSARAQERQSLQVPASRTTYCSGSIRGSHYDLFCN